MVKKLQDPWRLLSHYKILNKDFKLYYTTPNETNFRTKLIWVTDSSH